MTTFHTSRSIPASAEQVFAAISQPERLAQWCGPAGFTNTFSVCEFKTGGRWSFTMHGPDCQNYPNENVFACIEPPRKVVIAHVVEPKFQLTIALSSVENELGGTTEAAGAAVRTLVTWSQAFENAQVASRVEHIVVPANEQNLDRLTAEVLAHSAA